MKTATVDESSLVAFEFRVAFPPDVDQALVTGSLFRIQLRLEGVDLRVGASCRLVVIRLPVSDVCSARAKPVSAGFGP
jgi:hypothetical protein